MKRLGWRGLRPDMNVFSAIDVSCTDALLLYQVRGTNRVTLQLGASAFRVMELCVIH